jgi:heptosyltransferase-3
VLLLRAGALGDVLLLRRAVAALKSAGHFVGLVAPARAGSALLGPGAGEVDELFDWDGAGLLPLLRGDTVLPSALAGFDRAVVWSRNAEVVAALRRAIPDVIAHDPTPPPGTHASRWLSEPLAGWGLPADADPPVLVTTVEHALDAAPWIDALPAGFLAIHPGSGSPAKNWPGYADLVAELAPAGWLLLEGPADEAAAAPLRRLRGVVRAANVLPRTIAAVLARCGTYVGNDSGLSHLAAASGARTIALFGPTDPAVWSPVGPRVTCLRAPSELLEDLSPAEVAAAIR